MHENIYILTVTDIQIGTKIVILIVYCIIISFGFDWEWWMNWWLDWRNMWGVWHRYCFVRITKMVVSGIICGFSFFDIILIMIRLFLPWLK